MTEDQTSQALAIAATKAAGLKSQFGTMGKPLNAGLAAECGVISADLGARGFVSNPAALDGAQGFDLTHHGVGDITAFEGLGQGWHMEHVSHKHHACCHGLHAMIEALGKLDASPDDVAKITINTHPRWMNVCNIEDPTTGLEAKFSYRQTAAMVLRGIDTAVIGNFSKEIAADSKLSALRQRVEVHTDESLAETAASVSVTTTSGENFTTRHDLNTPMSHDEKWQRLRRKGRALVGEPEEQLFNATARQVDIDALLGLMS